jgi:hypothetical protein
MAYRERQKISQMTPKGANLAATDLIEISELVSGSYVTKSITGQEIISGANSDPIGIFAQTGNSTAITATTTELTLIDGGVGTLTVPANGFQVGDSFTLNMGGVMSAQNGNTITIRLKTGSVSLGSSGALTMPAITNQVWYLTTNFTIRSIGTAGVASIVSLSQFHVLKAASGTQEGFAWNVVNSTTFDTTISNTLSITAQWSSTNPNNSIYSDIFTLSKTF